MWSDWPGEAGWRCVSQSRGIVNWKQRLSSWVTRLLVQEVFCRKPEKLEAGQVTKVGTYFLPCGRSTPRPQRQEHRATGVTC